VRVSTRDRDLDEFAAEVAVITRSVNLLAPRPHHATLDQQFKVNRAPFIIAKAVIEGMPKPVQAEMLGTPAIGAVKKRTVVDVFGHSNRPRGRLG